MKKLIALTLSLAIILCFSFAVMAAPVTLTNGTAGSDNNGTQSMSTTFDADTKTFVTTVTGVTDQATLLVFSGNTLTTENGTNIEFIDQTTVGTTTEFTYKLKTDPVANATYTIKVGGSNLTTPLSQYVTPIVQTAPTTFTISGTVSNAADTVAIEGVDPEFLQPYNTGWLTTVNLYDSFGGNLVATTTVDPTSKTFSIADIAIQKSGDTAEKSTYFLEIKRLGFVLRYIDVTVDNKDLGDKPLIAGDFAYGGAQDYQVEATDVGILFENYGKNVDENVDFNLEYDVNTDFVLEATDVGTLFENYGKSIETYGDVFTIPE